LRKPNFAPHKVEQARLEKQMEMRLLTALAAASLLA